MMNSLTIAAIAGLAASKRLNGNRPSGGLNSQDIGAYNDYCGRLNKSPISTGEIHQRVGIYVDNAAYVEEVNAAASHPDDVRLEMNKFGDMTTQEVEGFMGLRPEIGAAPLGSRSIGTAPNLGSYPAVDVDHHAAGKMTAVKDQGQCGSCWAFASNTALEGTLALKANRAPLRLSEQHLVDCTLKGRRDEDGNDYGMYGCGGGWMSVSWKYQRNNGFMTNEDYPYVSGTSRTESACQHVEKKDKIIGKVTSWRSERNVEKMLEQVKNQPMSIAIYASARKFSLYKEGVLQRADCNGGLNHGVVVVGYTLQGDGDGDGDGGVTEVCKVTKWYHKCEQKATRRLADQKGYSNYWKVQNSWGSWWGDGGFVRFNIDNDGSSGVCGMYQYAEFVEAEYD